MSDRGAAGVVYRGTVPPRERGDAVTAPARLAELIPSAVSYDGVRRSLDTLVPADAFGALLDAGARELAVDGGGFVPSALVARSREPAVRTFLTNHFATALERHFGADEVDPHAALAAGLHSLALTAGVLPAHSGPSALRGLRGAFRLGKLFSTRGAQVVPAVSGGAETLLGPFLAFALDR